MASATYIRNMYVHIFAHHKVMTQYGDQQKINTMTITNLEVKRIHRLVQKFRNSQHF